MSHTTPSSLESLPVDVLVAFLSASDSLADLHAFIRSSPWLYKVFLASKRAILLNVISKDAGPVIRDYVALSLTPPLDLAQDNHHENALDAVRKYQSLPAGSKARVGINIEQVLDITQFQRTAHFFVDLYERTRLPLLAEYTQAAAMPFSPHERQRLYRAFVRHQVFTRLYPWHVRKSVDRWEVGGEFFGLFEAWEIEQVSVAHAFVFSLISAMHVLRPQCCRDDYTSRSLGWTTCPHEWRYTDDLGALRCKIASLGETEAAFMWELEDHVRLRETYHIDGGVWGTIDSLDESHHLTIKDRNQGDPEELSEILDRRKSLYEVEKGRPRLTAGASCDEPPFGWVDAMRGLNCSRWGTSLGMCFCWGVQSPGCLKGWRLLPRWRQLGFVFWDKDRVELLYENSRFRPGWLGESFQP
ncbi:hypothetical protein PG985_013180 [Apiospora marii]|uniref:F-box domain-containing protein n=1 Tax=Apiospora marii TaxID=335849 RepID=A0ABR1R8H4_9PEZI